MIRPVRELIPDLPSRLPAIYSAAENRRGLYPIAVRIFNFAEEIIPTLLLRVKMGASAHGQEDPRQCIWFRAAATVPSIQAWRSRSLTVRITCMRQTSAMAE